MPADKLQFGLIGPFPQRSVPRVPRLSIPIGILKRLKYVETPDFERKGVGFRVNCFCEGADLKPESA